MFIKEDLNFYKMFKSVIERGDFNIKGNAVIKAASLFMWYDRLEGKINDSIKEQQKKDVLKDAEKKDKKKVEKK